MEKKEINKLIHEKLFGKCWFEGVWGISDTICGKCEGLETVYNHTSPNYCGNIADAFAVVVEMEKRGFIWRLEFVSDTYYAFFQSQYVNSEVCGADTIPQAICLAALDVIDAV